MTSYKYYIKPTADRNFGIKKTAKSKHQINVEKLLKTLALNGSLTTWEMAKKRFANDSEQVRSKEKEFRRLLIGRTDRGRKSEGILDLGLVIIDSKSFKRNPGVRYRLSIYGILYSLARLNFSKNEIDKIAKIYAKLLPKVFGKWDFLKSTIGDHVYNIKWLGQGLYFENSENIDIKDEDFFQLISYLNIKFSNPKEQINEIVISELISYWFFITLLYFPNLTSQIKNSKKLLKFILKQDKELKLWFSNFLKEATSYYKTQYKNLENYKIFV